MPCILSTGQEQPILSYLNVRGPTESQPGERGTQVVAQAKLLKAGNGSEKAVVVRAWLGGMRRRLRRLCRPKICLSIPRCIARPLGIDKRSILVSIALHVLAGLRGPFCLLRSGRRSAGLAGFLSALSSGKRLATRRILYLAP